MVKGIPLLALFHCMFNALPIYKQANKQKKTWKDEKEQERGDRTHPGDLSVLGTVSLMCNEDRMRKWRLQCLSKVSWIE